LPVFNCLYKTTTVFRVMKFNYFCLQHAPTNRNFGSSLISVPKPQALFHVLFAVDLEKRNRAGKVSERSI